MSTNKILFLDRDGVINVDVVHLHHIEDCQFVDGIFDLCRAAKEKGYLLVIVTNQAGIAKGLYSEDDFHQLMDYMQDVFEKEDCPIDDVFFCPFHTEAVIPEYRYDSPDRKPNSGMLLKALGKHHADAKNSMIIGDMETDITAGQKAALGKTILYSPEGKKTAADITIRSLRDGIELL